MNLNDFHFIRPYYLLAFIPAIVLALLMLKNKLRQGDWSEVCDAELMPYVLQQKPTKQNHWLFASGSLAALLTIIALAGPTWERLDSPVFRNDAALVIALNLSVTMDATDVKPSRLVRARYKIADILRQRKDGLTALLVYSGDAFTVTPLTSDVATIENLLNALETNIMPSSGSNPEAALKLAVQLLQQSSQQQGDIFLITDGLGEQDGDRLVDSLGDYRLSILGVGTEQGAPITLSHGGFLQDAAGNIVLPTLPNSQLASLVTAGQGVYRQISSDDGDITALMKQLNRANSLGSDKQSVGLIEQWADKGAWLLLLVLPLVALNFRKGLLSLAFLLVLPMPQNAYAGQWQDLWQTKSQQAQQAFDNEQFKQAAELFQSPEWQAAAQYKAGQHQQAAETLKDIDDVNAYYNKANALAKSGQLEAALKAYQQALQLKPNDEDAQHNLKTVEEALKQQKKDQQESGKGKKPQDNKPSSQSDKSGESQETDQQNEQQKPPQDQETKPADQQESDKPNEQEASSGEEDEQSEEKPEQATQTSSSDEQKQANEQWLNKIKDDPAGLLKRKFKYQYGQRNRQQQ